MYLRKFRAFNVRLDKLICIMKLNEWIYYSMEWCNQHSFKLGEMMNAYIIRLHTNLQIPFRIYKDIHYCN